MSTNHFIAAEKGFFNNLFSGDGRKLSTATSAGSGLEIVAASTSDVEFKFSWTIDSFIKSVKSCKTDAGIDSKPFDINLNGVLTTWNLSVRFWVGETGERLANPFVLFLNLLSCKINKTMEVNVKYKFGIYNRGNEEFEMGAPEKVCLFYLIFLCLFLDYF